MRPAALAEKTLMDRVELCAELQKAPGGPAVEMQSVFLFLCHLLLSAAPAVVVRGGGIASQSPAAHQAHRPALHFNSRRSGAQIWAAPCVRVGQTLFKPPNMAAESLRIASCLRMPRRPFLALPSLPFSFILWTSPISQPTLNTDEN